MIQYLFIALHRHTLHEGKRSNQTRANLLDTHSRRNTASREWYQEAGFQMLGRNQQPFSIVSNQMTDPRLLVMKPTVLQVVVGRMQMSRLWMTPLVTAARAPDGGCGVDTSVCMQDSSNDKGEQTLTEYRESVLTDVCPTTPKAVYTSPTDSLSTSPSHQQAMHVPPQIHLRRCPVTPPNDTKIKSPKGKSLFCPELRRSPCLNTPKFKEKENTGEIALHHEPSDSEYQVKSYTPPRMFSRLASLSPKYPVVQLRDILSIRTCPQPVTTNHQLRSDDSYVVSFPLSLIPRAPTGDKVPCTTSCPHEHLPSEGLALSGRFHSRQYKNLCLWLARNGLLLVSKYPCSH